MTGESINGPIGPATLHDVHRTRLRLLRSLGFASMALWPVFLVLATMRFANVRSGAAQMLVLGVLAAYLVLPFIAPRFAVRAWERGRLRLAYTIALVPVLPLAIFMVVLIVVLARPR